MTTPSHLNALKAFEASARHQSFSAAAEELHVTPAAVGQLVRSLESLLGLPLFVRASSGATRLEPTEAARRALPDIREGFDRLALGFARLQEAAPDRALTVTVSPAFAAKWLLPRIERFQARHPQIDLLLDTNLRPVDLLAERVDIGVRYGAGRWPGLVAVKLMDEQVFPVCAPSSVRPRKPADLARCTLIHDLSMPARSGFPTWRAWLDERALGHVSAAHGLRINNSAAVVQAAIDGLGVALGRSVMVRDDLAAGRLVRPFGPAVTMPAQAYYAVYRDDPQARPQVAAFRDWLLEEVGALRA
jgi:LysR family glycine cleavage system transcriptional activator